MKQNWFYFVLSQSRLPFPKQSGKNKTSFEFLLYVRFDAHFCLFAAKFQRNFSKITTVINYYPILNISGLKMARRPKGPTPEELITKLEESFK